MQRLSLTPRLAIWWVWAQTKAVVALKQAQMGAWTRSLGRAQAVWSRDWALLVPSAAAMVLRRPTALCSTTLLVSKVRVRARVQARVQAQVQARVQVQVQAQVRAAGRAGRRCQRPSSFF